MRIPSPRSMTVPTATTTDSPPRSVREIRPGTRTTEPLLDLRSVATTREPTALISRCVAEISPSGDGTRMSAGGIVSAILEAVGLLPKRAVAASPMVSSSTPIWYRKVDARFRVRSLPWSRSLGMGLETGSAGTLTGPRPRLVGRLVPTLGRWGLITVSPRSGPRAGVTVGRIRGAVSSIDTRDRPDLWHTSNVAKLLRRRQFVVTFFDFRQIFSEFYCFRYSIRLVDAESLVCDRNS